MQSADVVELTGGAFLLRPIEARDAGLLAEASRTDIPEWTYLRRDLDTKTATAIIERSEQVRAARLAIRFLIEVDGVATGTVGAAHPTERDRGSPKRSTSSCRRFGDRGLASEALIRVGDWLGLTIDDLRRLQLFVMLQNPGSSVAAERAGYQREGIAVNQIRPSTTTDHAMQSLLASALARTLDGPTRRVGGRVRVEPQFTRRSVIEMIHSVIASPPWPSCSAMNSSAFVTAAESGTATSAGALMSRRPWQMNTGRGPKRSALRIS